MRRAASDGQTAFRPIKRLMTGVRGASESGSCLKKCVHIPGNCCPALSMSATQKLFTSFDY